MTKFEAHHWLWLDNLKKKIFFGFSVHILALILSIGSPSQVKRLFRMSIRFKPHRNIRKLTLTFNNPLRKTQKLLTYVVAITFFHDVKCAGTASLDHKNTNKNTQLRTI